ncbi:alkaline phosphatase [Moraxella caviae]|uniref:Alkaline phosphatase n=1 Tax=Moraxella caviae TaxID=34060 RepID=A0A1T0ACM0_9GAMM|nr:DedA family protein [Moraxella caviae]OOR93503.1 alkaline phosphatase [Moraxella caviae]STZ10354.1 Inner membrane protein YqjA [Moraxella caviae]VEW10546.1 Inner membrane protein YqjA [Moraxella caviae]VEW14217.1 Inner membrane protein YqjA [Moraxella caviae]
MDTISEWVLIMMDKLGLLGVVAMMFLENVFPPIPSELIMPAAGFAAAMGKMSLFAVIIAGTLGAVLGALPLYYLGTLLDEARLYRLAERYGKFLLITPADVQNAQAWFAKYGKTVVFFGRMIPAIRSLISIPAGMARMPLVPFLLLTAAGSAIWTTLLAYAGYLLGANYAAVETFIAPISKGVAIAAGVLLVFIVIKRIRTVFFNGERS